MRKDVLCMYRVHAAKISVIGVSRSEMPNLVQENIATSYTITLQNHSRIFVEGALLKPEWYKCMAIGPAAL